MDISWNKLSHHFNTYRHDPNEGVRSRLSQISEALDSVTSGLKQGARVLDFGCGTGQLCNQLYQAGYVAIGFDIATDMLRVARQNSPIDLQYLTGDAASLSELPQVDAIFSLMVFQFIDDLKATLSVLSTCLKARGTLLFSVHNPEYVWYPDNKHTRFENIDRISGLAHVVLSGISIPAHIRTENEYCVYCSEFGLKHLQTWWLANFADGTPEKYLVLKFVKEG